MGDPELIEILDESEDNKKFKTVIHIVEVPESRKKPIDIFFTKWGARLKHLPRKRFPKKYRNSLKKNQCFFVEGKIKTEYIKDLKFTEFLRADDKKPNDYRF